jgi:hypothetical protein
MTIKNIEKKISKTIRQIISELHIDLRKKIGDKAYFEWCSYNLKKVSIERVEETRKKENEDN